MGEMGVGIDEAGAEVASPKSITVAPSGTARPVPTALIVLPSTITMPFGNKASVLPSNSRVALSTMAAGGLVVGGLFVWSTRRTQSAIVQVIAGLLR